MYNRFAKMRHRYLREHRNGIYTGMFLDGKLEDHLKEIGEAAEEMFDRLVEQMKKAEGRESNGMGRTDEQHPQPSRRNRPA